MRTFVRLSPLLGALVVLWGCSHTVQVSVPPRMELQRLGTLGLVDFSSNASQAINAQTTREFETHLHAAQPGTRIVELGSRESLLAAVGSRQFDAQTLRKVGEKYGVDAIFIGTLTYSEPKADVKLLTDTSGLEGGARIEVRGDINSKLVEARTGASLWSSSTWARRSLGRMNVSTEQGVSAAMRSGNPREEMLPGLVYHLTEDFRPSTVRQQKK